MYCPEQELNSEKSDDGKVFDGIQVMMKVMMRREEGVIKEKGGGDIYV